MTAPIILICGFGRCGTSLVMQMLAAGGIPVVGKAPGHEEHPPRGADAAYWREHYAGRALKVLDPHLNRPPAGLDYRILWLDRDSRQQALSQMKFGLALGLKNTEPQKVTIKRLQKLNFFERPRAVATIRTVAGEENCYGMFFEQIINTPHAAATRLWEAFGQFSTIKDALPDEIVPRMARVIKFRSSDNYPGLMELSLMSALKEIA